MRDKLKNNINHIIQHQNSQVINKIFHRKKTKRKKLKSVQNVLGNRDPACEPRIQLNSSGGVATVLKLLKAVLTTLPFLPS